MQEFAIITLSTTDKVWSVILSLAISYVVFVFLKNLFKLEKVEKSPASISTFFKLSEIVEKKNLNLFANIFSGSAAIAVFFTSYFIGTSESMSGPVKKLLASYAEETLNKKYSTGASQILGSLPSPLIPAILIALLAFLFLPYLKKGAELWRDAVHTAIDFRGNADQSISETATAFREKHGENAFKFYKDNTTKTLPVPHELVEANRDTLFEYQLMYAAVKDVPSMGLDSALEKLLKQYSVITDEEPARSIVNASRALVAIASFTFFGMLYWSLIPQLSRIEILSHPSAWPNYIKGYFDLGIDIARFALSVVFPFISGLALYDIRRKKRVSAHRVSDDFIAVASAQIISSLLIGVLFGALYVARSYLHQEAGGKQLSLFQPRLIFDSLMPCAIAPSILIIQLKLRRYRFSFASSLIAVSIFAGILNALVSICYGCFVNEFQISFMQDALMGFTLILVAYVFWHLIFTDSKPQITTDRQQLSIE